MVKQLLILRHAKSDWGTASIADFDRPLNKRGEKSATLMGKWMKQHGLGADYIISSPALRARQTIERLCRVMDLPLEHIHWDKRIYLASVETLLEVLTHAYNEADSVLIVGHNPGLEELLVYLCGSDALPRTQTGKLLTTANLAQVMLQNDDNVLRAGTAELRQLMRPKEVAGQG